MPAVPAGGTAPDDGKRAPGEKFGHPAAVADSTRSLSDACEPHLEWLATALAPLRHAVHAADATGSVLCRRGAADLVGDGVLLRLALRTGRPALHLHARDNGAATVLARMAIPVRDEAGDVIGALGRRALGSRRDAGAVDAAGVRRVQRRV